MLANILPHEVSEFGVVLIERGQEVGGAHRSNFTTGTVARILQLEAAEGYISLVAEGGRRIEVDEWHSGSAYPSAAVHELDELIWIDSFRPLLERAERTVRRSLAVASEFNDQSWSATVELSDVPTEAAWQLAAIAPLAELDRVELLRATSMSGLLSSVIELTLAATEQLGNSATDFDDEEFGLDGDD